jgi:hypothetical protein
MEREYTEGKGREWEKGKVGDIYREKGDCVSVRGVKRRRREIERGKRERGKRGKDDGEGR